MIQFTIYAGTTIFHRPLLMNNYILGGEEENRFWDHVQQLEQTTMFWEK